MTALDRLAKLRMLREQIDAEIALAEQQVRLAVAPPKRATARCGTDGGYYRHRRKHNEPACEACKAAHRLAERTRLARSKEAA